MRQILIILFLINLGFLGCKKLLQKNIVKPIQKEKQNFKFKDSLIKKSAKKEVEINNILNKKLIPLIIADEEESNVYKKFQIDFYAACMCDSQSLMINSNKKKLVVYDYCYGDMPNNDKILYEFNIGSINKKSKDEIIINIENINSRFTFSKMKNIPIYKIYIVGENPIEGRIKTYKYFTFLSNQNKFKKEDCGDFDG